MAEPVSESEIQLDWSKNPENNEVMVASSTGLLGQPVAGAAYAPGDPLPGGGSVIYSGSLEQFTHSGLQETTTYYYKAFSFTSALAYSAGAEASATTLSAPPTLAVSPVNVSVSNAAGTTDFTVTSNSSWTAQTTSGWCSVTPSGTGNGLINVVYETNLDVSQRIAQITVNVSGLNPVTVTLTQAGAAPLLSVSPLSFVVPAESGSVQATVTSNTQWTALSSQPGWCTVTPSGTGNGTITLTYAENPRALVRNAIITLSAANVSPVTISVSQEAAVAFLNIDPLTIAVSNAPGSTQIEISSNFDWTAGSDQTWCVVTPAAGSDNATLTLNYAENTTIQERSATITVQGNSLTATTILVQASALAMLDAEPLSAEVPYESGSFEFIITSNVAWTANADATWLEVTPSGMGSGILKVIYEQNPSAEERMSTISLMGEGVDAHSLPFLQLGTGVGINENDPESLKIYPNPANEAITIEVNPAELNNFNAQLIAPSGKVIMEKTCSGKTKYGMDISGVKSGSYVIRLVSGEKVVNRILVIIR
jgi:hypothetical protein